MTHSASSYFQTETCGLRRRTISGGIATGIGQLINFALQFASIAILARLLSPSDFGLVAMVTAVSGFIMVFGDSGLSMATVQRTTITHDQVSTLFWINTGLGFALMMVTAAIAPALAWFYDEPRLLWITVATAVGFLIRGMGVQHLALLRRNLQFPRLIAASVGGSVVGYTLGVVSASNGLGYWSLVVQSLGAAAATTIAMWLACGWRPGAPVRGTEVGSMVRFGGALTGSTLLVYLLRNFDNLLVGWFWGSTSLGLYSRGYALMMLPANQLNGPINQVAMPALSRVQADDERFKKAYYQAVTFIAAVSLPACIFLAACAQPFILTVLGEKWREIVPIFVALAPAAALTTLTNSVGWVYNSLGRAKRQLKWTLFAVPVYLGGFAIALPYGPIAVATSFSILLSALFVPTFWFAYRGTPLTLAGLRQVLWRPVASALSAGALVGELLKTGGMAARSPVEQLCMSAGIFVAVYVTAWVSLPGGKTQIRGTWSYLMKSFAKVNPLPKPETALAGR